MGVVRVLHSVQHSSRSSDSGVHSGSLENFRGTWNLMEVEWISEASCWRTQYLADFDLRHRHYDPAGATERSVTSDTSPDDSLVAASSGIDSLDL